MAKVNAWLKNVPHEVEIVFTNLIASGDFESREGITLQEALSEALYVQSCFEESGHSLNESLTDSYVSKEERAEAKKEYAAIKRYVKKLQAM